MQKGACPFLTDPKPDIIVNIYEDFIICLIPGSVSPDTTCNLYVGEESQPSFTAKIMKRKATSASGQQFCHFTPKHSDLISRLQSVRRKEVSCDYRLSSGPNSLSLHAVMGTALQVNHNLNISISAAGLHDLTHFYFSIFLV
jgi:hypothetical protein